MSINAYATMPLPVGSQPKDYSGDYNLGFYAVETTQRYIYGSRAMTWDGKVFKYSHAVAAVKSGWGAFNTVDVDGLISVVLPNAVAIGDTEWTITVASGDGYAKDGVVAKDELVGGYVVAGHGEDKVMNRTIVANTAVASGGGTSVITVDGPATQAMTATTSYSEVVLNPYRYLAVAPNESTYESVMCVPAAAAGAGYNFWGQTWGPCWVIPGGGDASPGDTANDRTMYFVGDGSVNGGYALTTESGYQLAGFIIDSTKSGTGCMPLLMLQISI